MRQMRQHKRKNKEKPILFAKPEPKVIPNRTKRSHAKVVPDSATEIKKLTKKHHSCNWDSAVMVVGIIADVINPAMYIIFSVVYFMIGLNIRQNPY